MKYEFEKMIMGKGRKNLRIPDTAFSKGEISTQFYSRKNNSTTLKKSVLSDKIVNAIVSAQKLDFNIFFGQKDGLDVFIGAFDNASVPGSNYIIMFSDRKKITKIAATNINSHYLYTMLLAYNLYCKDKEAIKYYSEIDTTTGMIDSDQQKQLFILNDNIYWTAKELDGINVLDSNTAKDDIIEIINEVVPHLTSNITSLLNENMVVITSSLKVNIDRDIPLYEVPVIVSKRKNSSEYKKEVLNKNYFIYKDEKELAGLPEELVIRYKSGQEAFEKYASTMDDDIFPLVKALTKMNVICLTGEAGGGKTTIASAIAGCLGLPLITINGNNDTDYASMILDYGAKNGTTFAIEKPALLAYIHGGVVVIDEITRIKGEMSTALNAMLDTRQYYDAPNGIQYKKNPNFKVICTMNQGAGYSTEELDTSLIDRFNIVKYIQDPKKELAIEIISNSTGYTNKDIINKMWDVKTLIDEKAREEEAISRTSLRGVIDWINQSFITGEFVESAINTIIGKLILKDSSIYSQNIDYLINDCDNELVAYAVSEIKDMFEDEDCLDTDFD